MTDSIGVKTCQKCGACWINGEHYWTGTQMKGNEVDLASLVCRNIGDPSLCINPSRDVEGGDTWEERRAFLDRATKFLNPKEVGSSGYQ
jgi:hypothetical protein